MRPIPKTRAACVALVSCFLVPTAHAQVKAGQSICTVAVGSPTTGEIWTIDHEAGKATQLTLAPSGSTPNPLLADTANTILMTNPILGFVGTNHATTTIMSNIYSIQVIGNNVTATKLNTDTNNDIGGRNLSQIVWMPKDANHPTDTLYFPTQDAANTGGVLWSMPATGGKVTQVLDMGQSPINATGLANAACAIGPVIYIGFWDVTTTRTDGGELVAWDTARNQGQLVMLLPKGKHLSASTPISPGIVSMHPDQNSPTQIVLFGIYGDIITIDPDQANGFRNPRVVTHEFGGRILSSTSTANNYINSACPDVTGNDWVLGTRDTAVERYVSGHSAENIVQGVGTATSSVNGIHHFPLANNHDKTYGPGCAGPSGFVPSDVSWGAAVRGNQNFAFGLHSGDGGARYLLAIGLQNLSSGGQTLPWKIPGSQDCFLRMDPLLILGGTLTGTGNGAGKARVPVPLPNNIPTGARIYRQWAMDNINGGFALSNARETRIQ